MDIYKQLEIIVQTVLKYIYFFNLHFQFFFFFQFSHSNTGASFVIEFLNQSCFYLPLLMKSIGVPHLLLYFFFNIHSIYYTKNFNIYLFISLAFFSNHIVQYHSRLAMIIILFRFLIRLFRSLFLARNQVTC